MGTGKPSQVHCGVSEPSQVPLYNIALSQQEAPLLSCCLYETEQYSFQSGVKRWQITESQNGWGWKAPLEAICSTPTPLKQGQLQPLVQDHVQTVFVYLIGQRLHSLFGKLVSVLGQSHSEESFPDIRGNLRYFIWWLLSLAFSLGMNEESLVLLCPLPSGSFVHWWHCCPWAFSSPGWMDPALSEQRGSKQANNLCDPLLDSVQSWEDSVLPGLCIDQ